jgi:hypothetical protein
MVGRTQDIGGNVETMKPFRGITLHEMAHATVDSVPGKVVPVSAVNQDVRFEAFKGDLESIAFEGSDVGDVVVNLEDAIEVLRLAMSWEPDNETASHDAVTWVWPHDGSRTPPRNVRLRMPMDLPAFAQLTKKEGDAEPYILTVDAFAWGRKVHIRFGRTQSVAFEVFVADSEATKKVYIGKRGDKGDLRR